MFDWLFRDEVFESLTALSTFGGQSPGKIKLLLSNSSKDRLMVSFGNCVGKIHFTRTNGNKSPSVLLRDFIHPDHPLVVDVVRHIVAGDFRAGRREMGYVR